MKNRILIYIIIGAIMLIYLGRKLIPAYLEKMALAIMNFEGYWEGSRSQRNNNPGNIKFANQPGSTGKDEQGHAIFDSFVSGWNALINQLRIAFENRSAYYHSSMTLYQFFSVYAEANTKQYAEYVARELGVSPNTTLDDIKWIYSKG